jgi:hypothetical protein
MKTETNLWRGWEEPQHFQSRYNTDTDLRRKSSENETLVLLRSIVILIIIGKYKNNIFIFTTEYNIVLYVIETYLLFSQEVFTFSRISSVVLSYNLL